MRNKILIEPIMFTFNNKNYHSIFEGDTSMILCVDSDVYDKLEDLNTLSYNHFIQKYKCDIFESRLKTVYDEFQELKQVVKERKKRVKSFLNNSNEIIPSHFVITLTNNCNFACKYCYESGKYYHETPTDITINIKKVYEVLDWLNTVNPECSIGFYGGEPLLEFDKIESIVKYCKDEKYKFSYSITTNGFLLDSKKINYFIKNKFNLSISYDGKEDLQNKYRKTRVGGSTYEIVKKNIKKIETQNKEYFYSKVLLMSTVYDYEERIIAENCINEDFPGVPTHTNQVSPVDENQELRSITELYKKSSIEGHPLYIKSQEKRKEIDEFINTFESYLEYPDCKFKKNGSVAKILRDLKKIVKRDSSFNYIRGTCSPFGKRPSIDVYGNIYPCEKIMANKFIIGNDKKKYDYKKINIILKEYYNFRKKYCKNCWARNLCDMCMNTFLFDQYNEFKSNKGQCYLKKQSLKQTIGIYSYLLSKYDEKKVIRAINETSKL